MAWTNPDPSAATVGGWVLGTSPLGSEDDPAPEET